MSLLSNRSEVKEFSLSLTMALIAFGVVFGAFGARLWQLQLLKGQEYRDYALNIATQKRAKPAERGIIFDTTGQRLADNRASFDLKVTPSDLKSPDEEQALADRLSQLLTDMSPDDVVDAIEAGKSYSRYQPALIKADLSRKELASVDSHKNELPKIEIDNSVKRTYLYGDLFAQQIGYLGEVGETELPRLQAQFSAQFGPDYYTRGQYIGRYGLEAKFEPVLKGRDGRSIVAKDRLGRELSLEEAGHLLEEFKGLALQDREEIPGDNIRLGIDLGLQQTIAQAFGDKSGAAVVLDVHTGLVRAMFNHPAFDPEIFARGIRQAEWDALQNDPNHPLEDKAIRGMYPPGSTFKLFVAAAGLATGVIDEKTTFTCTGSFHLGHQVKRCWNAHGHGTVNLHKAIQQSCDVYFYNVALRVGMDRLAEFAKSFGLGAPTGIGINNEKSGIIPTTEWKRMNRHEEWVDGETLDAAIGQGFDLVTPLQLAVAYAAIANGGHVLEPHLVEQITGPDGKVIDHVTLPDGKVWDAGTRVVREAKITPAHLSLLQDGLRAVVNEPGGTGWYGARIDVLPIAGKTGTAQVYHQEKANESLKASYELKDHAWFAAYAPADNPEIAMAILVEHGEHGASASAPIARKICEYWFRNDIAEKRAEQAANRKAHPAASPSPTPGGAAPAGGTPAPEGSATPGAAETPAPSETPAEPADTTAVPD